MIINGRPGGYGRDEEGRKGRTGKVRGVGWGGGKDMEARCMLTKTVIEDWISKDISKCRSVTVSCHHSVKSDD